MPEEFPKDAYLTADERLNRINEIWDDFITEFKVVRTATLQDANRTVTVTADYYPSRNDVTISGDTTSAGFTIYLDPNPIDGQTHAVSKKVAANTLTISGNGKNINGSGTDSITTQYATKIYRFLGGDNVWRIISSS